MKKIYFLATCDTCRQIINRLGGLDDFERQDIKTNPMTERQLEQMKEMAGSYEVLFSRRAIKYRTLALKDKILKEADYKRLILEEYTFLKRPVILLGKRLFIGNDQATIEEAERAIKGK